MKRKSLFLRSSVLLFSLGALAGCGNAGGAQDPSTVVVWVGDESVSYYRALADKYVAENPDFGYTIQIVGTDTGGAGAQMVNDNTACGDIVTIAHDNIGKLSRSAYIVPIVDDPNEEDDLLKQIKADNPESFLESITNILSTDTSHTYTFGAPYISQALFLYYNKKYVSDEQANTLEGLLAAAKAKGGDTKALQATGTDGFNFCYPILSRNLTNGNTTSLRLYVNGEGKDDKAVRYDSYLQTNEEVAIMRYFQRFYKDKNGLEFTTADNPWETAVKAEKSLAVIGGAWQYNSFKSAVDNMGCKIIPSYTLTAEDVAGIEAVTYPNDKYLPESLRGTTDPAPQAGTEMRGGSFVDCKCFVLNAAKVAKPERYYKLCKLIKYFSSKEAQNNSYLEAFNVPAYKGSEEFIEEKKSAVDETVYLMASAQTGMNVYGIPQPFATGALNTYYYQKKAPDYYVDCLKNTKGDYDDVSAIRKVFFRMEYIWKHGGDPARYPSAFPSETSTTIK